MALSAPQASPPLSAHLNYWLTAKTRARTHEHADPTRKRTLKPRGYQTARSSLDQQEVKTVGYFCWHRRDGLGMPQVLPRVGERSVSRLRRAAQKQR